MTLEVRSNPTPTLRTPPTRLPNAEPLARSATPADPPLRGPHEATTAPDSRSFFDVVSDFLGGNSNRVAEPNVHEPQPGSKDGQGFFDNLGDLAAKIPEPIRDLLGKGLGSLGDKIKDLIFGGDDKSTPNRSDAGGTRSTGAVAPQEPGAQTLNTPADTFESTIGALLRPNAEGKVHEEELFASLVSERLKTTVSPEAAKAYETALQESIGALTRPDGSVPVEQAAIEALKQVRDQGLVTPQQADQIYSQAFAAAQLDDSADALFDDRGSETDPTIATGDFAQALASAKERVAAFDAGTAQAPSRSLEEAAPTGGAPSTAGTPGAPNAPKAPANSTETAAPNPTERKGFLWKPESDKDGKLVVLLPSDLAKDARSVVVRDANGDVVAKGKFTGVGNGDRAHFRFDRAGRDLDGPVTVEAKLADGTTRVFRVKDPSRRVERQPT